MTQTITVEVAYGCAQQQTLLRLEVPQGTTLKAALRQSGLPDKQPEMDLDNLKTGIFGKLKKASEVLRENDRIEIYRPLIADPKQLRKERQAAGKRMKKGN